MYYPKYFILLFCLHSISEGITQASELLFPFCEGGQLVYIDTTGKTYPTTAEKLAYPKKKIEKGGFVPFKDIIYYGYKDGQGNIVIPPTYEKAGPFREGIAWIKLDHKRFYYINEQQKPIGTYTYDRCYDFQESMGRVYDVNPTKGYNGYGFVNKSGLVVISLMYEDALDFVGGYALVREGTEWWLINQAGDKLFRACTSLVEEKGKFFLKKE